MGTDESDLDIVQMWRQAEGALDQAVAGARGPEPPSYRLRRLGWSLTLVLAALFAALVVIPSFAQNVVITGQGVICDTPDEVRAFIELDDIRKVNAKLKRAACGYLIVEYSIDYDVDRITYYGKAATITKITVMGIQIGKIMLRTSPPTTQYTIFLSGGNES